MANRNRNAGNQFERDTVTRLKEEGLFPFAVTSRAESRNRDNQKVDVMNADEHKNGRMPYDIQCKSLSKSANYMKLLDELPNEPGIMPVIFHKATKKSTGGRFMTTGTYALMRLDDFYNLMKVRKSYEFLLNQLNEKQLAELKELGL